MNPRKLETFFSNKKKHGESSQARLKSRYSDPSREFGYCGDLAHHTHSATVTYLI